ncbi:hypothetical protein B566_EDAN010064 [Ephemera danica]|nr:hypothetical protein B566_EDAN010064 [Ephemera danica]
MMNTVFQDISQLEWYRPIFLSCNNGVGVRLTSGNLNQMLLQWFLWLGYTVGYALSRGFANEWVVRVPGGELVVRTLAQDLAYAYVGQVEWAEQQAWRHRQKRGYLQQAPPTAALSRTGHQVREKRNFPVSDLDAADLFNDELWDQQWYMQDTRTRTELPQLDLRVVPVFARGVSGRGVRVTDPEISYDLNNNDPDPTPRYLSSVPNSHGTRCAGEIAMAANNRKCGVGVAFNAKIGGVRMLDGGDFEASLDRVEGEALAFALDKVDIYSASWGPKDDGATVEGPGRLAMEALERGAMQGRNGKGAIYVWAAGNGGGSDDDCNCDGYASSVFTLSVGSASEHGRFPWYGEQCSSTLACTYSSGAYSDQMIVTTDLYNSCTVRHTGTSAAAPLAAGIVALALEVNSRLTWRDVQHLVVWTAEVAPLADNPGWQRNAAGLYTNTRFGFGLMNALALVETAANWTLVNSSSRVLSGASPTRVSFAASREDCNMVNALEHVEVKVSLEYPVRGVLEIALTSPSGTRVSLLSRRPRDASGEGFQNWSFMSVHTWGETPHGTWNLDISDVSGSAVNSGWLRDCELILHGTVEKPEHMKLGPRDYGGIQWPQI